MGKPDERLFEEWFDRYGTDVLRTAYFYVDDKSAAEDIFQDVFIKIYKNMDAYRGEASVKTWIIRITVNQCKDYFKSSWFKRVKAGIGDENIKQSAKISPENIALMREEKRELFDSVLKLPLLYREVLILFYYHGFSEKEIADILKIPAGTVRSRLYRAKEILKLQLSKGGNDNGND